MRYWLLVVWFYFLFSQMRNNVSRDVNKIAHCVCSLCLMPVQNKHRGERILVLNDRDIAQSWNLKATSTS